MKVIPSSPVAHFPRFFKLDGVVQHIEGEHHQLYLYSLTILLSHLVNLKGDLKPSLGLVLIDPESSCWF